MTIASATKLAALIAILPAAVATGCNAHPLKEVEYQTGGDGIDIGDDSGADADDDAGDAEGGDDAADGDGDGDDGDDLPADDGADDSGDDGEPTEPSCTSSTIDVSANPPEVMLVLDKSTSMVDESWIHDGESRRRWESLHGVVSDVTTTYDASMNFGAVFFPALDAGGPQTGFEGSCRMAETVDVAPGPDNATAILDAMPGATDFDAVRGRTPARAGIQLAADNLAGLQTQGARAMILVTDGLANCADDNAPSLYDQAMPEAVAAAAAQQIPTYVVGIDIRDEHVSYADANAQTELDLVARAGGVPASTEDGALAFYDAADEDGLYEALDAIAARVECTVPLDEAAPQDAIVSIAVDGLGIPEVGDCTTENGWTFTDATARSSIELCGTACDALRVKGEVTTTACEPVDVPEDPALPIP